MTEAVFTRGSTMRHVVAMTAASATGLLTMFGVDMVDMYFLTLLGEQELAVSRARQRNISGWQRPGKRDGED